MLHFPIKKYISLLNFKRQILIYSTLNNLFLRDPKYDCTVSMTMTMTMTVTMTMTMTMTMTVTVRMKLNNQNF